MSRHDGLFARLRHSFGGLTPEQRRVGLAAIVLWLTLLLPWYHENVTETVGGKLLTASHNVSGFGAFSFVEASVLLVSVSVLALLFYRGEQRAFHLPGGDAGALMVAGGWQAVLIFYRMLDAPHLSDHAGKLVTDIGVQWGIFIALFAALSIAYGGARVRVAHQPEPLLADDPTVRHDVAEAQSPEDVTRRLPRRPGTRRPPTRSDAEQLSFDVPDEVERDPFG